jgi:hypothetical protein
VMTRRLIAALRGEPESDPDVEPEPARFIARDSVRAAPA